MPIVRYFLVAGAFVVALLCALDRSMPPLADMSAGTGVDRSIIRIHSASAWPEKIVFDTSTQIATVVSSPLLATERRDDSGQALAIAAPQKPEIQNTAASPQSAVRATSFRSNRTARAAASRRPYDRQLIVGAFREN
ncbi:hypothetical protein FJN17_25095 [Bradyrhizobium symbiodeficiens]|uniref:Uncharacterized protein n=1 Tax=Bradyrhizobium symbiodeficiens TaxID=1404367 RepID=A0ABX5WDJ4_9BRAD|nr:hypothetical protein [Bradyrhizobium symbiodeficiens]QDF40584.1 hypothetical protein FJN17_25095 [Bradyrhizobium symbiodeficiens]